MTSQLKHLTINLKKANKVYIVAGLSSPRDDKHMKAMSLYTIRDMKYEYLKFDYEGDKDKFIKSFKNANKDLYWKVGEIGLFECILSEYDFIHLFFDIDHIDNREELDEAIEYLNGLSIELGYYSLGGYTNNEQLAEELHIPFCDSTKFVSLHAVFYETKISYNMLRKWFKPSNKFIDEQTWTNIINRKDYVQTLRLAISDKVWSDKVETRSGGVFDNKFRPLKHQELNLVSIRGDEYEITDEMFERLGMKPNEVDYWKLVDNWKPIDYEIKNYTVNTILLAESFDKLPKQSIHNWKTPNISSVMRGINASTNDADERKELYDVLYNSGCLSDDAKRNFDKHASDNIDKEGWLGCLINTLKLTDNWYNENYKDVITFERKLTNETNESVDVDESNEKLVDYVDINDIKKVSKINDDKAMKLLKKCFINARKLKCFLSRLGNEFIECIKYEEMKNQLKACGFPRTKLNDIVDELFEHETEISCLKFNDIWSNWKYDKYREDENVDYTNVNKWLDCVLLNTFNNEKNVLNYCLKRESYILHNPGKLSKVCVVIQGIEGTGKNYYERTLNELHSGFSNSNLELSKAAGRFNISTLGLSRGTSNEALDATGRYELQEFMKKMITEDEKDYERKGIDAFKGENTLNLDITTNNLKPVLVSPTDRRYVVIRTNPINADKKSYWDKQYDIFKSETFYNELYHYIYYKCYDDKFLSLDLPMTEAKKALIKACVNPIHIFIINHIEELIGGIKREYLTKHYKGLSKEDKLKSYSENTFVETVLSYCIEFRQNNKRYYRLTDTIIDKFSELIDEEDEEEDDEENNILVSNEEQKKIEDEYEEWIENNKHEEDKFYYLLMTDINGYNQSIELIKYLKDNDWNYKTHVSKKNNKRCYKLMKQVNENKNEEKIDDEKEMTLEESLDYIMNH